MVISDARKTLEETRIKGMLEGARKPRLCLDIDGVVVQYDFVELVKRYFGVDIEPESIYAYNLADVLGVSSKEIDDMFQEQVWGEPEFMDNALDTLDELSKIYQIIVYSNRVKYMGEMGLIKFLIDYKIPFDGIDYGQDKYKFHIDDRPEKLQDTDSSIKLLYTQPWNVSTMNIKRNLIRVDNWLEIRNRIMGV